MTRAYAEPFSSISPNFVISRLAADSGVIAVLNGSGADEIFAGYERFDTLKWWRGLRWLSGPLALLPPWRGVEMLRGVARQNTLAEHFVHRFGLFDTETKRTLLRPECLAEVSEPESARTLERLYLEPAGRFADDVQATCMLELSHYVGNHFVNRADAMMMSFSLEGRFPFLDHELVEFGMRVPTRLKIRGKERKWIVRRVAARYVDESSLRMKKKGFTLPLVRWMEGPLRSFVDQKLTALADSGEIFRPEAIRDIRDGRFRPAMLPRQIWYLVSTQLWREILLGASAG